jgi:pimeloyl-ACP methyl ester carboxylesterase
VDGDRVRLHYVSCGRGPLVVLLHGFPDFWYGWRRQLPALADAGFRAVAVDLRGYNLSGRPARVEAYRRSRLASDIASAIARLGGPAHAVVGHDWGGVVGWRLSVCHAESLRRLVIVNAPHPARYRELLREPAQVLRSWYVAAVQLPWLPERLLGAQDAEGVVRILRAEHARPDALSPTALAAYRAAFRAPGALTAALAYYRALRRTAFPPAGESQSTPQPTLVVWGDRDGALLRANADGLERWVRDLGVVRVPWAKHFVPTDAPDELNDALVSFLSR